LLDAESTPASVKARLGEIAIGLDPLKLLEEIRALQSHLVSLADKQTPSDSMPTEANLVAFMSSLSEAWRNGEVRPTHLPAPATRFGRVIAPAKIPAVIKIVAPTLPPSAKLEVQPTNTKQPVYLGPPLDPEIERQCELRQKEYARRYIRRKDAFTLVWPLVCRRLEGRPNMNARELFDELRAMYPGRWHRGQLASFTIRVGQWRRDAIARGIEIGPLKYRQSPIPRGRRRPDPLQEHWADILKLLEEDPDQTARELMDEIIIRYPSKYSCKHLRTLQRRLKVWRKECVQQLIFAMEGDAYLTGQPQAGNIGNEASGNKVT
jgi:hypothetical protein